MAYNVASGEIIAGMLYYVTGMQSVVYESITYNSGQYFRGVKGVTTFVYSGVGSTELNEVTELTGFAVEFTEISNDQPIYTETTILKGFGIEYDLNEAEKIVNEVTRIQGFALEFVDYPFYSFEITETRL